MEILQPQPYLAIYMFILLAHFILLIFAVTKLVKMNRPQMDKFLIFLVILFVPIIGPVVFLRRKTVANGVTVVAVFFSLLLTSF